MFRLLTMQNTRLSLQPLKTSTVNEVCFAVRPFLRGATHCAGRTASLRVALDQSLGASSLREAESVRYAS